MPADRERVSPFRRRQFVAPHRRKRLLLRLFRPFLSALLVVGVPAAAVAWSLTSPVFALREVTVSGSVRVSEEWVRQALAPLTGRHLLWVRLDEIDRRLRQHRWIREVTARKELPSRLAVRLSERRPEALLRAAEGLFYVDRDGFVMGPFDPRLGGVDLPLVSGIDEPESQVPAALELARSWQRLRPHWAQGLSEIERLGWQDHRLHSAALPFPIRVGGAELATGLERLDSVLPEVTRRYAEITEVDLRFSHQIVVKPALVTRNQEG